jgi:hypothetical protein
MGLRVLLEIFTQCWQEFDVVAVENYVQFLMKNVASWSKEVLCGHSLLGEFFAN